MAAFGQSIHSRRTDRTTAKFANQPLVVGAAEGCSRYQQTFDNGTVIDGIEPEADV
jgi:hypothetical protein